MFLFFCSNLNFFYGLDGFIAWVRRTIAMFLESYPLEEQAIDTTLFLLQGREIRELPTIHIHPEYEREAKKCLAERDANIIREQEKFFNPYSPPSTRFKRGFDENRVYIHSLLSVKEMAYYHIPSQFYDIISKCHNSNVGHWGVEETITKVKEFVKANADCTQSAVFTKVAHCLSTEMEHFPCLSNVSMI